MPGSASRRLRVTDPESLVGAIRGASLEAWILSGSQKESEVSHIQLPGCSLDQARFGPSMLFRGAAAKDRYMLAYVADCPQEGYSLNFGTPFQAGCMGFYAPGEAIDTKTPQEYRNATLSIHEAVFHDSLASHFPEYVGKAIKGRKFMSLAPAACKAMNSLLASTTELIHLAPETLASETARYELEGEVLDRFFDLIRSHQGPSTSPPRLAQRRHMRLKRARDFIEGNSHRPIRLEELCTVTGLSRRGLEYLFIDLLGISAGAFLLQSRLHGVRGELLKAQPSHGEVKRCALNWGFWHLGRFASDYRSQFGEPPKVTLFRSADS